MGHNENHLYYSYLTSASKDCLTYTSCIFLLIHLYETDGNWLRWLVSNPNTQEAEERDLSNSEASLVCMIDSYAIKATETLSRTDKPTHKNAK